MLIPPTAGATAPNTLDSDPPRLIETMLLRGGAIALWPLHRARLLTSARELHYPMDAAALDAWLSAAVGRLLERKGGDDAASATRLRLLLTHDGALSLESSPQAATPHPVRLAIADERLDTIAADPHTPNRRAHEAGARLNAAEPWLRHKTTYRPWFTAAAQWLRTHPDYFDLIFSNTAGELCEGSRCNVYVQNTAGQWLTPTAACGLLPGVQRRALLDQGAVREARLTLDDLASARAVRISNAVRGWLEAQVD